jgi:hypothetical protein
MDGVHLLRKRQHTRLWYRTMPASERTTPTSTAELLADVAAAADEAAWAQLLAEPWDETKLLGSDDETAVDASPIASESVRQTRRLGRARPAAIPDVERPAIWDEWRTVPASAPSLLLSATDLLDARNPGPVLRPGARYRVAGVQNGVVGLHVADPDGASGLGYCAAVDLICIDDRFGGPRSRRPAGVPGNHPFRSRMQRLTGGLSQATAALAGIAASTGSRLT